MEDLTTKVNTRSISKLTLLIKKLIRKHQIIVPLLDMHKLIHRLAIKYKHADITTLELINDIKQQANSVNKTQGITYGDLKGVKNIKKFKRIYFINLIQKHEIQIYSSATGILMQRFLRKEWDHNITEREIVEHIKQEANIINKVLKTAKENLDKAKQQIKEQTHKEDIDPPKQIKYTINDVIERVRKINSTIAKKLEIIFSEYDLDTELHKIKSLTLKNCELNDISIFNQLKNIEELDLGKNNIKDISPISSLTGIKHLNLGSNNIDDIRCLENLTSLKLLKIGANKIKDQDENVIETKDENEFKWLAGLSKLYLLKIEF